MLSLSQTITSLKIQKSSWMCRLKIATQPYVSRFFEISLDNGLVGILSMVNQGEYYHWQTIKISIWMGWFPIYVVHVPQSRGREIHYGSPIRRCWGEYGNISMPLDAYGDIYCSHISHPLYFFHTENIWSLHWSLFVYTNIYSIIMI